ncbi:MAG: protein translocase subunit SecF [Deltaproteobacteria bacterium]|jgi:preprotein translocase subunit SecF|nr:protein translocase subunit SecF [Deltaproteobacteria bacterium]
MGLHLVPNDLNIDFVGFRRISYIISAVLIIVGISSIIIKGGLRYGIDFEGGAVIQIKFDNAISDETIKNALADSELPGLVVQGFGDDSTGYLLRVSMQDNASAAAIRESVDTDLHSKLAGEKYEISRLEIVGPKVGADLRSKALGALYLATLLMAVYVSGRFEHRWGTAVLMAAGLSGSIYILDLLGLPKGWQVCGVALSTLFICWRLKLAFALGALISVIHDLLVTVGLFSILNKEFDLTIIAALLTVVGYSINDTIIVYDRIRENFRADKKASLATIINNSINQTLSRTVLTSGTTLMVIVALLILGGDIIHDFALALLIGIAIGTFSSIFVASPILMTFENTLRSRQAKEEEASRLAARRRAAPQV